MLLSRIIPYALTPVAICDLSLTKVAAKFNFVVIGRFTVVSVLPDANSAIPQSLNAYQQPISITGRI